MAQPRDHNSVWQGVELTGEAHDVFEAALRVESVVEELDDAVLVLRVAPERASLLTSGGPRSAGKHGDGAAGDGDADLSALKRISAATGARIHVPPPPAAAPEARDAGAASSIAGAPAPPPCVVTFEGPVSAVKAALAHAVAALLPAATKLARADFTIPGARPPVCVLWHAGGRGHFETR